MLSFQIGVFMGFAIFTAILGFGMSIYYGFVIAFTWLEGYLYSLAMATAAVNWALGVTANVIGITTAIGCCQKCCASTLSSQKKIIKKRFYFTFKLLLDHL